MDIDPRTIGANISRYRLAADLTQIAAAQRAGVHPGTWNRWENGALRPSLTKLGEIADVLGVTVVDLLTPEAVAS